MNSLRTSHTNLKQMWHGITTGSLLKNNDRVLQHGRILATIKSMSVWTCKCKLMFLMESQGVLSFIKRSKHWRFLDMCRKFWINFRQRTVQRAGKLNSGLLLRTRVCQEVVRLSRVVQRPQPDRARKNPNRSTVNGPCLVHSFAAYQGSTMAGYLLHSPICCHYTVQSIAIVIT